MHHKEIEKGRMYQVAHKLFTKIKKKKAVTILFFLENYVNGAILQWERIQEDKGNFLGLGSRVDSNLMQRLFMDIHFYFICGDKVQQLYKEFVGMDGSQDLQHLWAKYEPMFRNFNDARNHLEHLDQRIRDMVGREFGNLIVDTYVFCGKKYDIGPSSLKELKVAYEELVKILGLRKNTYEMKSYYDPPLGGVEKG